MNGTATTCSSAIASGCFAPTSSTTAATRRWEQSGATSTSRRSVVRRLGRNRQRATPRPRHTSGGTGTTTTTPRPRLTRSGSRYPTLEKLPSENAPERRKRAKRGVTTFFSHRSCKCFRGCDGAQPGGEILAKCALAAVRKGKTMTEHVTGGSEVERDPREMRTRG